MTKTIHVIFDGEVLRPEEVTGLELNTRYLVTIEQEETSRGKNLWDVLNELAGTVDGPEDWSSGVSSIALLTCRTTNVLPIFAIGRTFPLQLAGYSKASI
ncbi:MAG: hypothetical protein AB1847_07420 [bacterium]